jgi:hypothetical protein
LKSKTTVGAGTSANHDVVNVGQSLLTLASATSLANFVEIYAGTVVNTGTLTVNGATVARSGSGPLTNRGFLTVRSGTFTVGGTYTQAAGVTTVAARAHLDLSYVSRSLTVSGGVLQGAGTIGAGVMNNGGTIKPAGSDTGTLHISGAYMQGKKGTLAVDLAAKSRDVLAVQGAVALQGKLAAHNVGGYSPRSGAKYRVLSASAVSGSVSCAVTSGGSSGSGHWVASRTAGAVYLAWRAGRHTTC